MEDPLNEDEHYQAVRTALLRVRPQWRNIALVLGFPNWKLREYTGTDANCMDDMLTTWITYTYKPPTWGALATALRDPSVDGGIPVAREIEAKYGGGKPYTPANNPSDTANPPSQLDTRPILFREITQHDVISRIEAKWEQLADQLWFEPHEVSPIERNHQDVKTRCREVLKQWLEGKGVREPRTWGTLLDALRKIGNAVFADELAQKL